MNLVAAPLNNTWQFPAKSFERCSEPDSVIKEGVGGASHNCCWCQRGNKCVRLRSFCLFAPSPNVLFTDLNGSLALVIATLEDHQTSGCICSPLPAHPCSPSIYVMARHTDASCHVWQALSVPVCASRIFVVFVCHILASCSSQGVLGQHPQGKLWE